MKVILQDEVFREGECAQSILIDIISFGYYGKHDIITDPLVNKEFEPRSGTNLEKWLSKCTDGFRHEILFILQMGIEEGVGGSRARDSVNVIAGNESDWNENPPRLTIKDAQELLSRSLHLLVENSRSDGNFIKTMIKRILGPSYWKPLKKAIDNYWLHIENGGGVVNMKKIIDNIGNDPIGRKRTSAIFDSDAPAPGEPSEASKALREKCREYEIDCQQLKRRAIENYLPREALRASVNCGAEIPNPNQEMVDTFCDLSREQRHYFHMKKGFEDEEISENPPSLFETLKEEERLRLKDGFGKEIANIFREDEFEIEKSWIEKDYQREDKREFEEIFNIIVSKI